MRSLGVAVAARALAVLVAVLPSACADAPASPAGSSAPLRIAFYSPETPYSEQPQTKYRPVAAYFEKSLRRPIELSVSGDAGQVLADFEAGRFDVVFNRAFVFPHAQKHAGAIPLVTRREDRQVTTVFLAQATDGRQTLQDFRGARLAYSNQLGSSYVIGRRYFEQQQIDPNTFFREVTFANATEEAIRRVQKGLADLGVTNSLALDRVIAHDATIKRQLKIVAETPPHIGQVWFTSKELSAEDRQRVRDAFLALDPTVPEHARVLALLSTSGFVPAMADDYMELTELMQQMHLLDFDLRQIQ